MLQKLQKNRSGFTLVEIMIVVAIIALLAAIAVPGFIRARKRSQATRILEDLRLIDAAVDQYAVETNKKGGTAVGSVQTSESTGVWIIGMRYKIINAETTEQVATGYTEEKMEVGATSTSVLGVSQAQQGGVSLDTMVQRLVQKSVWEIDSKYK